MYLWFSLAGIYAHGGEDPALAVRPFCNTRTGTAIGELGCSLILENYERARARDAHIYGEILGFADAIDPNPKSFEAMSPDGKPYARTIQKSLEQANVLPDDIDFVIAHGTGTKANDHIEIKALDNLYQLRHPPTVSLKGITGHGVGACASLEIAAALMAMDRGELFPNANLFDPEQISPNQNLLNEPMSYQANTVLKMGSGFGGYLSSIVLGRR